MITNYRTWCFLILCAFVSLKVYDGAIKLKKQKKKSENLRTEVNLS